MKEIKAFIRRHRVADVIDALKKLANAPQGGIANINLTPVENLLKAAEPHEQHYSMELAQPVVREYKLELLCEDDRVPTIMETIASHAQTGQQEAGWIVVLDVAEVVRVDTR